MALFNWSAQYETGIFMVDTQHKKLVDAINTCLLYTSDAADERSSVDLGGRRIIKKKKNKKKNNKMLITIEKTIKQ